MVNVSTFMEAMHSAPCFYVTCAATI